MGEETHLHQDPEEAEEALSLCDLPLDTEEDSIIKKHNEFPSDPPEFFEFLSDLNSNMSSAEEIIFRGKLVPFKEQQPISIQTLPPKPLIIATTKEDGKRQTSAFHRRSESLSGLQSSVTRSNSSKTQLMRNSRSLDYQKLYRLSRSKNSQESEMERNPSGGKSDFPVKKGAKPRWYLLMFGMVKFPPEMELRDIKSRQIRRNPSTLFPAVDAVSKYPANRSSDKGSWKFLKALSCKDHASVAVTASFCMPQV